MADGSGSIAFLGVERSLSGRAWRERRADARLVRAHQQRLGLGEPLARALASRGVTEADGESYLSPTLRGLFPDPSCFADMDRAAEILIDAIVRDRPCAVFADYDVDGGRAKRVHSINVRGFASLPSTAKAR